MKTVIMTPELPAAAPEKGKATKFFAHTQSTKGLSKSKNSMYDLIGFSILTAGTAGTGVALLSMLFSISSDSPAFAITVVFGGFMALVGLGITPFEIFDIVQLKKYRREAISQATDEVSSWLQENYEINAPEKLALHLAEEMSTANAESRTWKVDFTVSGKQYNLRCNSEGLFYVEDVTNEKALTEAPQGLPETIKSLAAHASSSAITKAEAQLLESLQTKVNSLAAGGTRAETKMVIEQITAEAVKAAELNEKLAKLNPDATNSKLSSILQLVDSELDNVLQAEVAEIEREMEKQTLYLQSRQTQTTSNLKLDSAAQQTIFSHQQ